MRPTAKKIIISILASTVLFLQANALSDALKIRIIKGTYTDETVVRFVPTATTAFDGSWDAYKVFSSSPVIPSIYTRLDSLTELSINAFPSLTAQKSIPLYLHIKTAGIYTLQSIELGTGFSAGCRMTLEDLATGVLYNFSGGNTATFNLTTNTLNSPNRFVIHITPRIHISVSNARTPGFSDGTVNIIKAGNFNWNYSLKNTEGDIVVSGNSSNETTVISGLSAGDYVLYTSGPAELQDSSALTISEPAITTLSNNESGLSTAIEKESKQEVMELSLNNGDLTIRLQTSVSSKITVVVFSGAGQKIAFYSYNNISYFSENVQLNTSGTYVIQAIVNNTLLSEKISVIK
jgi:hypothetical protein